MFILFIYFFLYLQPIKISDLQKVDPFKACAYFNNCFKDPSTFTIVIVGNIDPAIACPLILQYLVSGMFSSKTFANSFFAFLNLVNLFV